MTDRLAYSVIAAYGRVLFQWTVPVRTVRVPWALAYTIADALVAAGTRAETQAGLTVDRVTPQAVAARCTPGQGEVLVDLGRVQEVFDWSPGEAFAVANALVETGEIAQRWAARGPGLTPKEVDRVEEAIVGEPKLALTPPPLLPSTRSQFVPGLKQTYYYRPAECNARVLTLQPEQRRANILLPTGRILEGVAWADLLAEKPRIHGTGIGIPSTEVVSRPTLTGG
jgi:hypothetical protein